jgi:ribonuclease Z
VAKWKHPKVTGVSLAGEERDAGEDENLCYQDSDVIVWPLMDVVEDDAEGAEVCALCRFRERREMRIRKRKRGGVAEGSSGVSSSSSGSSEEEEEEEEEETGEGMIEQRREQNRKETRECSSKPPPPPPPPKRMLGYVLEVLEKEDEDEFLYEREGGENTHEPVRILILNCTEKDVKKSKHALCKCLSSNNSMRKHNISGLFFLSSSSSSVRDGKENNVKEGGFEIDRKNVFTIGGGGDESHNEVGFRSSMRHLARLHCAAPSVFPLPESLMTTSKCQPREEEEGDDDSRKTSTTLGLCDEVAFYSNRKTVGEKNRRAITRGEEMLNERTGDPKLPKLALRDVFENLERFDTFKENARKAKRQIFGSGGDVQKKKKGEEKDPEEKEDEGEEDLLPASFGKYPAHPKKGRAAPLSALGGPETIFLGTGCAEPSKYRAASAILLRDEEEGGASKSSILLDCGEGCLGAMRRYLGREECLNALKTLKMIWISHHHPDHCLGILAILDARYEALRQQASSSTTTSTLTTPPPPLLIVGPTPIQKWFETIEVPSFKYTFVKSSALQARGGIGGPFHISIMNKPGLTHPPPPPPPLSKGSSSSLQPKHLDVAAYVAQTINCEQIVSVPVTHCPEAFAIILRGLFTTKRSVAYSGDCTPSKDFAKAAYAVDILIHEATFGNSLWSHAKKKKHCTTEEALRVGRESNAKTVCLTHFSQRYPKDIFAPSSSSPSPPPQYQQNQHVFACAFDGMRVKWEDWDLLKSHRERISEVLSLTTPENVEREEEEEEDLQRKMEIE